VDVGGGVTNVVVQHHGRIRFTRILPNLGGDDFTAAIAEALGVEAEAAEALKRRLSSGARSVREEAAAEAVRPLLERLAGEVRSSVDFYTSQAASPPVTRLILTGGGSLLAGMAERLGEALGVPVARGQTFSHAPVERDDVSNEQISIAEPFLGVAVGLALAENGG
jgi:type IV pilus assembly protein PilM